MGDGKYYWLKLKRDFFKRHDIQIVESMQNGKDYILFYLKLLCESVDHDGNLRFSERIPYSDEMLCTITNTNVDIVRSAVKVFTELGMMDIMDDGTIFMTEVQGMIGSAANNDNALRQQRFRDRQKELALLDRYECVTENNESKSKKEIQSKSESKERRFTPPTVEDVTEYVDEKGYHFDPEQFVSFYSSKGWKVGSQPMKDWHAACVTWEGRWKQNHAAETPKMPKRNARPAETHDYDFDDIETMLLRKQKEWK